MVWYGLAVCVFEDLVLTNQDGFSSENGMHCQGGSHSVIPSERDTDSSNLASNVPFGRGRYICVNCVLVC